ncbi:hypothetical protein KIPB_011398 [Kipferlia bialata]|uniref:C3H1-type domain-containing protein n=1 Tax=Kipferlia bialata TaxID=797122 RepID=A0A391NQJ4_9EUKA|nr:hypothetical protein KIPB_011398 [Kipferlia bialata]|eukprot:g11398.t1
MGMGNHRQGGHPGYPGNARPTGPPPTAMLPPQERAARFRQDQEDIMHGMFRGQPVNHYCAFYTSKQGCAKGPRCKLIHHAEYFCPQHLFPKSRKKMR